MKIGKQNYWEHQRKKQYEGMNERVNKEGQL